MSNSIIQAQPSFIVPQECAHGTYTIEAVSDRALAGPRTLAVSSTGLLYVVEEFSHCIQVCSPSCEPITTIGAFGSDSACFNYPTGIAIDASGYWYVTDRWNHRVQKFAPDNSFVLSFGQYGHEEGSFSEPSGICISPSGEIIVADCGNARLTFFTGTGEVVRSFGHCGPSSTYYENALFKQNHHYRQWLSDVSRANTMESRFAALHFMVGTMEYPEDVCVVDRHILVADRSNEMVSVFSYDGSLQQIVSRRTYAYFPAEPSSLRMNSAGWFVADESAGCLYAFCNGAATRYDFSSDQIMISGFHVESETNRVFICDALHHRLYRVRLIEEVYNS